MKLETESSVISFKTAKLAKEKGLPQNRFNTSWYNAFGTQNGRTDLNKDGEYLHIEGSRCQTKEQKANNITDTYLAPIQAIIQRWLREEHNIQVWASSHTTNGKKYIDYVAYVNGTAINDARDQEYQTYESALEEGLFFALLNKVQE
jgi:hypothetical protein